MTEDLQPAENGGTTAEYFPVLYDELRRLARQHMAPERRPQTLTPTALVHEAWLRVGADGGPRWESRRHFFGAAAQAMRCILLDRARRRAARKRGGPEREMVALDDIEIAAPSPPDELLALDAALQRLNQHDPAVAEIVTLRYFGGLNWGEIAQLTGLSERELNRQWAYARAWLRTEITESAQD